MKATMQYGIEIGAAGACGDPRSLAELAHIAEDAGWDGFFLEDYIVYWNNGPTYDPWIALAAIALNTSRIRLGALVTPLARRRPWKVARETVTLDHLSHGRLILGVGLGHQEATDLRNFGEVLDNRQRGRILDEALDVLLGLWSGEPFRYTGQHFHVEEVTFLPRPVQTPRIPIWIGGGYPNAGPLRRAPRCDGAVLYRQPQGEGWTDMTPEDVRSLRAQVASQRDPAAPYDIAIGGRTRNPNWEQERDYIRSIAAGATWWMEAIEPGELEGVRALIARGPLRID
jgi:alkanesulfonate monooxygenase SsuD/methylene tetrahydromethanopterin reductase-like flavin-dependent oxidoreductase (luciferase family)